MAMDRGINPETQQFPVYAPTIGIIGHIPSTMLDPRACVNCNNVRFKDGVVSKRTGYVAYGSGTITGVPLLLFRYQKWNLTEYEMLVTTTNVYYNNAGTWTSIASGLNGTADIRASMAYIENYLVFTNGIDAPSKWDGTTWNALDDGKTIGWADYRPKIFVPYKDRLIGFNDNKAGAQTAIRQIYSCLGDFDNVNDTGSGFNDFVQGMGAQFIGAAPLKDYVAVYKDHSCCLLNYIGGSSLYGFYPHIQGVGLAATHAIANLGTSHIFLGSDLNIHEWNGGWELNHIGDPIKKMLQSEINVAKLNRCFAVVNLKEREAHFYIVVGTENYPSVFYTYNFEDRSWSRNSLPEIPEAGQLLATTGESLVISGVEKMLVSAYLEIAGSVACMHYNYAALNDIDVAISAYFETGDFVLSKQEHQARRRRWNSISTDIKGSGTNPTLSIQYSSDEGTNYSTAITKNLSSTYAWDKWNFLKTSRKLRLKFSNALASQSFSLRYYGLEQKEGERQ